MRKHLKLLSENKLIIVAFVHLRVNWQLNQDSSIVERQARYLEVRVRVLVQIFILKFNKIKF